MASGGALVMEVTDLFDRPQPTVTVNGDEIAFADAIFSVLDADAARRSLDGAPQVALPPEVVAQLQRDYYENHYREWLDSPVPALGHRTPREAAGVKKLRVQLMALIESIEIQAARQAREGEGFDASFLRTELGLPPAP